MNTSREGTRTGDPDAEARLRVQVISGVRLYRESLAHSLALQSRLELVGAWPSASEPVQLTPVPAPDVVLIEASECDAHSIALVLARWPDAKVVAYAVSDEGDEVIRCAEAGARGYVTREATVSELVDTVFRVSAGEFPCSPRVAAMMARRLSALASGHGEDASMLPLTIQVLTLRERQVFHLIDAGLSNKEIARRLGIELSTVKHHVHEILQKTQARRRYQATARLREDLTRPVGGRRAPEEI